MTRIQALDLEFFGATEIIAAFLAPVEGGFVLFETGPASAVEGLEKRVNAAGFSLDLKELVAVLPRPAPQKAICAPWGHDAALRRAIADLRAQGEVVLCALPGHEHEVEEFECDRALVPHDGAWVLQALPPSP